MANAILAKLTYSVGKSSGNATPNDWLTAAILVVRDRVIDRWIRSAKLSKERGSKRVYYMSLEFLIGRLLRDALGNLGLTGDIAAALRQHGVELDIIAELEPDAALGNGGLGRLAACFMESMASVGIAAHGYGIRYEHGLFRQKIIDGTQVELPEDWLVHGNPWEFERRERQVEVGFGGSVVPDPAHDGRCIWTPTDRVLAVPYDTPIVGWRGARVNTLRLWSARSIDPIRLDAFNRGDHVGAFADRARAESLTRVLYPADSTPAGQELRLRQEYFFTAASLRDLIDRHMRHFGDIRTLPDKIAIQLNDTHPAITIVELVRILVDEHHIPLAEAFELTKASCSYTNHTLLPEALESWPVHLFERLLPRHMQLVYAINAGVIAAGQALKHDDFDLLSAISLIEEHGGRRVRMGNLAFVGAHKINGVSGLHSELMKQTVFHDLNRVYPGRIVSKTNGVTPRRWLQQVNPELTGLVRETIGDAFLHDAEKIAALDRFADDAAFRERFLAIKRRNKERLSRVIFDRLGIKCDPSALFDVHIKRIHEYKRQLLNIVETIALYDEIRANPGRHTVPRVKIFAGKAAASYAQAKLIIRLINDVGRIVNSDPSVGDKLKVVFIPNYNVSLAEVIIPGADVSEQISTAGMEASGTGNMKFAMNGAITIGTLDGANVEIKEHVGDENIVIFGLTAEEVAERRRDGYNARALIEANPDLREVLDALHGGVFAPGDEGRYRPISGSLYDSDWFMVCADFASYVEAQRKIEAHWQDRQTWGKMAVHNTARTGWFSSDRTIREYASEIWRLGDLGA
ncbi:MAG: glycogen/starch/alpha-glucan phosphorylase [Hyphomicrobiaceae bacterium]